MISPPRLCRAEWGWQFSVGGLCSPTADSQAKYDIKDWMRTNFTERKGKLEDLDRSFDIEFWQAQPPKARFDATWELIVHAEKVKGRDVHQLKLQRSIEKFQHQ